PAGNRRRLAFRPALPPVAGPCAAGLAPGTVYDVTLLAGAVQVAGRPLTNAATASFATVADCTLTGFDDVVPGPPFVVETTPAASDPAPAPIPAASIEGDRVTVQISEALWPASIGPDALVVRDALSGAHVPGTVVFEQADVAAGRFWSKLELTAVEPLAPGRTYEILVAPTLTDFVGNALGAAPGTPATARLFATVAAPYATQPAFVETFDDAARLSSLTGVASWGTAAAPDVAPQPGSARFGDASQIFGDGSDGAFVLFGGGLIMDTDQVITVGGVPQSRRGVWNFQSFLLGPSSSLRFIGPWPVHLRCLGDSTASGLLNLGTGSTPNPAPNQPWDQTARNGVLNNGSSVPGNTPWVIGGKGNAGGGDGGMASQSDLETPPGTHTFAGQDGFGPPIDGQPNLGPSGPAYAGGQGGDSGFFPASFPGELGGMGGAGGSGATPGEPGSPRTSIANGCTPIASVAAPGYIAQPRPVLAGFIPPIVAPIGGSGGGGGGDRLETTNPPNNDEQGGSGGGGGGALRWSALGALTLTSTATISANGGAGGLGALLAGHGGSGSGGSIWLQSIGPFSATPTSILQVIGPARAGGTTTTGCANWASGGGGQGLIQLENTTAQPVVASTSVGAVVASSPPAFVVGGGLGGEAVSQFFDSGTFAPDWIAATETVVPGSLPGASLVVTYEGAHADFSGTSPDFGTLKTTANGAPIVAGTLDALDGYRFVRFRIRGAIDPSAVGTPNLAASLPRVDEISLTYAAP
ncbi:MAG TPA: Ig-like domain-containing protein, partial [Planctomycetota bacterium]|nr:Ig-like domain-containing protein [Planctomycetota bacterium]